MKNINGLVLIVAWDIGGLIVGLVGLIYGIDFVIFVILLFLYGGFYAWLRFVNSRCPNCGKDVFFYPARIVFNTKTWHMLAPGNCPHCGIPLR